MIHTKGLGCGAASRLARRVAPALRRARNDGPARQCLKPGAATLLAIAVVLSSGAAAAPAPVSPHALASAPEGLAALPRDRPDGGAELTKADADAWLDGLVPYALQRNEIAGAVVVIVKDGRVLTQRGFGYADVTAGQPVDPSSTLFRIGSISKLFTWTAVMQLVEAGKINLDGDVNRYLDFPIPAYNGKPITMRNLMTHTPGFEELDKDGIRFSGPAPALGDFLKRWTPRRIFAPGTTPAYSNYGAALAGYVVERVSGESFDSYVEQHIFQPLGMLHATFRQPLPAQLAPLMSRGYERASGPARPFELIAVPPAGSASMSGADIAKFMIAQLAHGEGLMKPETAQLMQTPAYVSVPGTNLMALGFYEQQVNGVSAIAHGGDLNFFHSYLWLVPTKNVGLFVSLNSAGQDNFRLRLSIFEQFADRYFPAAAAGPPVELPSAKEHARMLVGSYFSSRGSFSNFLDVANLLGQVRIGLDEDGRPLVPAMEGLGDTPRKWIETAPFVWQDAYGHQRLGAEVRNDTVVRWSVDELSPFMVYLRAPWYRDAAWLMPMTKASLATILACALSWPLGAIVRRRYGVALSTQTSDGRLHRLVRGFSWLALAVIAGWALLFTSLERTGDGLSGGLLDGVIWLLEIMGAIGFLGLLAAALWNLKASGSRHRGWLARLGRVVLALASVTLAWVAWEFHLISFGTHF
jgi:CubicO group peptidase (beta-lactamase class C family)